METQYDSSRPWYGQSKNFVRGYFLSEPYKNVFVGCDPRDGMTENLARQFQAFVNVSDTAATYLEPPRWLCPDLQCDEPSHIWEPRMHWFPINECGYWGYAPLYWSKKILDHHHERGDQIYLHCHAGAHRSPMIAYCWLLSRGHSLREAARILGNRRRKWAKLELQDFIRDYRDWGLLPTELKKFYERIQKNPTWSLASILLDEGLIERTDEVLIDQESGRNKRSSVRARKQQKDDFF